MSEITQTIIEKGNRRATNRAIRRMLANETRGQQQAAKRVEKRGPSTYDPRTQTDPHYRVKVGRDRVARLVLRESRRSVPDHEKPSKCITTRVTF